jgi:hypothetical protein
MFDSSSTTSTRRGSASAGAPGAGDWFGGVGLAFLRSFPVYLDPSVTEVDLIESHGSNTLLCLFRSFS